MLFNKNIMKKSLVILIIMAVFALWVIPINNVYAATEYTQTLKSGIDSFPQEYKTVLEQIKKLHPNWNFEAYYTGMDWNTAVLNETATHGRNRVIKSSELSWICSCGNIASGYACASEGIVKYYLDPRNFLNEVNIFQFLEISYNSRIHNIDGIKNSVKNTFLDNTITYTLIENDEEKQYTKHYAEIILEAAKQSNMSPYSIATKIIQEVGTKGSGSVSGTYDGYEGYYNFYNLGAYDTGNAIVNGLKYAKDKGWNNQYKAIIEGAKEIANSYTNAGQNTAYFYKWDVVGTKILKTGETQTVSSSNMFWHQYMTNVQDPTSQSRSLYNTYAKNNILDEALNFIIPVYNNMPSENAKPSELTTKDGDLYYVNCTDGLNVRSNPSTSATALASLSKNTVVVVLERECAEANGYKWDKVKLANGLTGYIASKYLTFKAASTAEPPKVEEPTEKKEYKYEGSNIIIVPGIELNKIDSNATGELKTGGKINVNGNEFTVILKGDSNGDGKINSGDLFAIVKHLNGSAILSSSNEKASDVNGDGKINSGDLFSVVKHLNESIKISL